MQKSETIHNNNNDTLDIENKYTYESIKKGYQEMNKLNLELANESTNCDLESIQICEETNYDELAKAYAEVQL